MNSVSTVCGGDKYIKAFQLWDGSIINCMILDTAGQERFNSLSLTYYRKADAVLLVYDISKKGTFYKLKDFYSKKIKENCKENIPILLLGNKTDLEDKREVTYEEGSALALEHNYEFKESSCLENKNVAGAFEHLIESWNFEIHKQKMNTSKSSTDSKEEKKSINNKTKFQLKSSKLVEKKKKKC